MTTPTSLHEWNWITPKLSNVSYSYKNAKQSFINFSYFKIHLSMTQNVLLISLVGYDPWVEPQKVLIWGFGLLSWWGTSLAESSKTSLIRRNKEYLNRILPYCIMSIMTINVKCICKNIYDNNILPNLTNDCIKRKTGIKQATSVILKSHYLGSRESK